MLDGVAERRLEVEPTGRPRADRLVEDHAARPTPFLCDVHGGFGVPQQVLGRLGARRERDAARDGDIHLVVVEDERVGE